MSVLLDGVPGMSTENLPSGDLNVGQTLATGAMTFAGPVRVRLLLRLTGELRLRVLPGVLLGEAV